MSAAYCDRVVKHKKLPLTLRLANTCLPNFQTHFPSSEPVIHSGYVALTDSKSPAGVLRRPPYGIAEVLDFHAALGNARGIRTGCVHQQAFRAASSYGRRAHRCAPACAGL